MPGGRLLVFTGPSHSGKSSAAKALIQSLDGPGAHVAIDEIITWFEMGDRPLWEDGLSAAYDVAASTADRLLGHDFTVIVESTFTFVPEDNRPEQFHQDRLEQLLSVALERGAFCMVIRFRAGPEELMSRQSRTGRLNRAVVEGTWRLHRSELNADVPVREIGTEGLSLDEVATRVQEVVGEA